MKIITTSQKTLLSSIALSALLTACGTSSNHEQISTTKQEPAITSHIEVLPPPPPPHDEQISEPMMAPEPHQTQRESARKQANIQAHQKLSAERLMTMQPATGFAMSQPYTDRLYNIQDNEQYAHYDRNGVIQTQLEPVSTFSIDVDTGSYSNVRRLLNSGHLPVADAVRSEEMINYFNYNYPHNGKQNAPFTIHTETGPSPWSSSRQLIKIGIKAVDIEQKQLPPANLVFLIDVSGSMSSPDKLGLLKKSLSLLVSQLRAEDSIALVVYAGASGIVLEPTAGNQKHKIIRALNNLAAGGSTNGGAGIQLAYEVAQQAYKANGINRILLATDGDFNVGTVNFEQLINLVEHKRETGISLSTLGFGTGNYNDKLMEQLADAANGQYSYIDNLNEAQKVLVDEISSSLKTVAKDAKIQIEFNPQLVSEYRLIGYENRLLAKEDFNNDKVDAGDIGAGKTVTALYEIVLKETSKPQIDPLRYQAAQQATEDDTKANELAFVKIRYKEPTENHSRLLQQAITKTRAGRTLEQTSADFRFAVSVAGFAELLKGGKYQQNFNYEDVIKLARSSQSKDSFGYRHEFLQLVRLTQTLHNAQFNSAAE